MIDIHELAIGDWVTAKMAKWDYDSPETTHPMQIVVIDNSDTPRHFVDLAFDDGIAVHSAFVEDLIPIPITAEILAANGFNPHELSQKIYEHPIPNGCVQYFFVNRKLCMRNHNAVDIEVANVHELQHILRLAGVNIEIKL